MRTRKQELLEGLIGYLVRHGPSELSLRPMAAEIGTSARLLIFHFQSKEQLLAEVHEEMHARLQRSFALLREAQSGTQRVPLLRAFWNWATAEENFGYLRLQYQLQVLADEHPGAPAAGRSHSRKWLATIQAALPPSQRNPGFATLLGAVFDGLFLELMSTGDRKRTTQALDHFIKMARNQANPEVHSSR